jgi:hypothetical protein
MGFLYPEFLFAWLLMSIPIIIHLFNFRKFKKVYFTNVQFLKDVQLQTSSTQKLKEQLILAARLLTIFFLVLAFAQPYIKSDNDLAAQRKNVISIYLDNSYSMEAVNKNGSLLDEGKRKAKELLEAYQLNDRFQLLTNDFEGKQQRLLTKEELLEELNEVKVSPFFKNYQAIVNRQQEVLLKENEVNRIAYLISDFQKQSSWKDKIRADTSININAVTLTAIELPNVSIDSVYFLSPIHQPNGKESLVFVTSNHSTKAIENISIKLMVNGVQKALGNISLAPQQKGADTLAFSGLSAGWQNAELVLKDYPITFDDQLKFSFEVKNQLPVLAIYQQNAVRNIAVAYQTDVFFDFNAVDESQINYSGFSQQQIIVLENLKSISSGLAQQLKAYVEKGGSLTIFIPLNADLNSYQQFLTGLGADYPTGLKKQTLKAEQLNLNHPVFEEIFDQIPKNLDLPIASSYFEASSLTRTTKQILIKGQGNENLLSAYQIGKGSLYVSFLPIEVEASNFALHALFLPILFKTAFLGNQETTLFYTIGQNTEIGLSGVELSEAEVLKLRNQKIEIIPQLIRKPSGSILYIADQIKKPGFYQLFDEDKIKAVFAFNESREESLLAFYKTNELQKLLGIKANNILISNDSPIKQQIKQANLGSFFWKLCLILSIIFLLAEILLIRFFKGRIIKS